MYVDAAELFSIARRALMLPHSRGLAASIAECFRNCDLGLENVDGEKLPGYGSDLVHTLRQLMDTKGLSDPDAIGLYAVRAMQLFHEEQITLSRTVDELALLFARLSYE